MSSGSCCIITIGSPALRPLNLYLFSHVYTLHTAGTIGLPKSSFRFFPKDVRIFQPPLSHEPIICNKSLYVCIYSTGSLFLLNTNAVCLPYFLNTWVSYLFTFHHCIGPNMLVFSHYVQLFVTPWTAVFQIFLSFTISQSLLRLIYIKSMMPFNHLIHLFPFSSCL